jgi:hypothetical protein
MTPYKFPEANVTMGRPGDLADSQCRSLRAYTGQVKGGSMDGAQLYVTAWQPTDDERAAIAMGAPVFLSCLGRLPPHFLTASFEDATRVA